MIKKVEIKRIKSKINELCKVYDAEYEVVEEVNSIVIMLCINPSFFGNNNHNRFIF